MPYVNIMHYIYIYCNYYKSTLWNLRLKTLPFTYSQASVIFVIANPSHPFTIFLLYNVANGKNITKYVNNNLFVKNYEATIFIIS